MNEPIYTGRDCEHNFCIYGHIKYVKFATHFLKVPESVICQGQLLLLTSHSEITVFHFAVKMSNYAEFSSCI